MTQEDDDRPDGGEEGVPDAVATTDSAASAWAATASASLALAAVATGVTDTAAAGTVALAWLLVVPAVAAPTAPPVDASGNLQGNLQNSAAGSHK